MNKGVTFIELIIVIAILSIIILVFFPKINADKKILMANARMLWNDIREARYIRMTQGIPMRISFPRDYDNYYIVTNGKKTIKTVYMSEGIKIYHNFKRGFILFSINGAPSEGSSGTIKIFDKKTKEFVEITIVPATGRILLKE